MKFSHAKSISLLIASVLFALVSAGSVGYVLRLIQGEHANVERARGEVQRIVAEQQAVRESRKSIEDANKLLPDIEKLYVHSDKVALFLDEVEEVGKKVVPSFEFTFISTITDPVDKNVVTLHMLASGQSTHGELVRLERAIESLPYKISINSSHFYTDTNLSVPTATPWTAEFDVTLLSYTSL